MIILITVIYQEKQETGLIKKSEGKAHHIILLATG